MGFVMRLTMRKKNKIKTVANGDIFFKKKKKQCDCEFRDHLYKYHVSNINLVKNPI
jgi:adenylate kinase